MTNNVNVTVGNVVVVDNENINIIAIAEQGPPGPPGASGGNYLFVQSSPASSWTITHNLSKYPSITVIDSGGTVVEGDINHVSINQAVLNFSGAFSGEATCN